MMLPWIQLQTHNSAPVSQHLKIRVTNSICRASTLKHHFGDATIKSFVLQIAYGAFTIAKNVYITQCGGRAIKTLLQIAFVKMERNVKL